MILHTLFDLTYINVREMRTVAAFASFFLVLKLYDWLRLFEKTAFYVKLLSMTLQGIGYFMLLLGIGLLLFGIPLSMISLNRILDDQRLIKDRTFFWLVDIILNQYLTALGEFATLDAFTGDGDDVTVVKAS